MGYGCRPETMVVSTRINNGYFGD